MSIFFVIDFLSPAKGALKAQPPVLLIGAHHAAKPAALGRGGDQRQLCRGESAAHEGLCLPVAPGRRWGGDVARPFAEAGQDAGPFGSARSHFVSREARRANRSIDHSAQERKVGACRRKCFG
jgi:hypothetical protein